MKAFTVVAAALVSVCHGATPTKTSLCAMSCRPGGMVPAIDNDAALLQSPCFVWSNDHADCYVYNQGTTTCPFSNAVDCNQLTTTTTAPTTTLATTTKNPTTTSQTTPSSQTTTKSPTSTSSSTSDSSSNATPSQSSSDSSSKLPPYLIAAGVALIGLGILVAVLIRKSRRREDDDEDDNGNAVALHVEQRTKQFDRDPSLYSRPSPMHIAATAYTPSAAQVTYTPTTHSSGMSRKQSNDYSQHSQQNVLSSPYHGNAGNVGNSGVPPRQNISFIRPRLPSGPQDVQIRIEERDYRALEAERGSVTF
ncbi:unnamed protein product [Aphanomyces euteiches]